MELEFPVELLTSVGAGLSGGAGLSSSAGPFGGAGLS